MLGKKVIEILVFDFGLRQRGDAAFGVPGIGHRQFGAGDEFRIRIGVDQGLQGDPRHVEAVVLHGVHGAVEQDLVGLLGADVRQRIVDLLVGAGDGQSQHAQQKNDRNTT